MRNTKTNQSQEQLLLSTERRIKHLMVGTLESFEDRFPDLQSSRDGAIFKAGIRTKFNDALRAQRDELRDYDVEYRPLRIDPDAGTLTKTRTFMETVELIQFVEGDRPGIKIYAAPEKARVLESVRNEFGAGVLYLTDDERIVLEIAGTESCAECVLSIMDKYRLADRVRKQYQSWRQHVVDQYRS